MTRPNWLTRVLAIALVCGAAFWPVAGSGQDDPQQGDGLHTKDKGHLSGDADNAHVELRTQVKTICDALDKAAKNSGQDFKAGDLQFKGHAPWVAKLICDYVTKAQPGLERKLPVFADDKERRKFVGDVLDAIEKNAKLNTRAIARDRILVGELLYRLHVRQRAGTAREDAAPQKVARLDIARSIESPDILLLAMAKRNFDNEGDKKKLIEWLKAGETFVLRVHTLAESGRILIERGLEWPINEMGQTLEELSHKFQNEHFLLNTSAHATLKQQEFDLPQDKAAEEEKEKRQSQRKLSEADVDHVTLTIDRARSKLPVTRKKGLSGLSLFEYKPLEGARSASAKNTRLWYVQGLASGTGSNEPGGITLPMTRLQAFEVETLAFPDRLFDESTKAKVETRITVLAACVVRIQYYYFPSRDANDPDKLTRLAAQHERKHFDGIETAWFTQMDALDSDLRTFADSLNNTLGLEGTGAFQFESRPIVDLWRPDPTNADMTAVPEGPLGRAQNASYLDIHPNLEILRFRLLRKIGEDQNGQSLLDMLQKKIPLDPKESEVKKAWEAWLKANWRLYRNRFVRDYLISGLVLDAAEGALTEEGQEGRPELQQVLATFRKAMAQPDALKKDPLEVLKRIPGQ